MLQGKRANGEGIVKIVVPRNTPRERTVPNGRSRHCRTHLFNFLIFCLNHVLLLFTPDSCLGNHETVSQIESKSVGVQGCKGVSDGVKMREGIVA